MSYTIKKEAIKELDPKTQAAILGFVKVSKYTRRLASAQKKQATLVAQVPEAEKEKYETLTAQLKK